MRGRDAEKFFFGLLKAGKELFEKNELAPEIYFGLLKAGKELLEEKLAPAKRRYLEFSDTLMEMDNIILGATIETNRTVDYLAWKITEAPAPDARLAGMWSLRLRGFNNLMVSIEPILDFNLETFVEMLANIRTAFVYVGYDNYNHKLPEPPLHKAKALVRSLREKGIQVYEKTMRKAWFER